MGGCFVLVQIRFLCRVSIQGRDWRTRSIRTNFMTRFVRGDERNLQLRLLVKNRWEMF